MKKMLNQVGTGDDHSFLISRLSVCKVLSNPYVTVRKCIVVCIKIQGTTLRTQGILS